MDMNTKKAHTLAETAVAYTLKTYDAIRAARRRGDHESEAVLRRGIARVCWVAAHYPKAVVAVEVSPA